MSPESLRRQAPNGGYDFAAKAAFRESAWSYISRGNTNHVGPVRLYPVLLLPSIEGLEINVAREHRCHDIIAVDNNPKIARAIKKRFGVMVYGCDVGEACERLERNSIRLGGASLDLCGPICPAIFDTLRRCAAADCWLSGARVVVNILRGREPSALVEAWNRSCFRGQIHQGDRYDGERFASIIRAFTYDHNAVYANNPVYRYVSSGGTSFMSVRLHLNRSVYEGCDFAGGDIERSIDAARTTTKPTIKRRWQRKAKEIDSEFAENWYAGKVECPTCKAPICSGCCFSKREKSAHAYLRRVYGTPIPAYHRSRVDSGMLYRTALLDAA